MKSKSFWSKCKVISLYFDHIFFFKRKRKTFINIQYYVPRVYLF